MALRMVPKDDEDAAHLTTVKHGFPLPVRRQPIFRQGHVRLLVTQAEHDAIVSILEGCRSISCVPVQRTDQSEMLRKVKPMISSAVDEIQAMFLDAFVRTSDGADESSSCSRPEDNRHDGEWRSSDMRWIEFSSEVDETQLLDGILTHTTAEGWAHGNNSFTNGVGRLGMPHADGGYIFLY